MTAEWSGWVMFHTSPAMKAAPETADHSQKARRRTTARSVPRSLTSRPTVMVAATQASPSGRMQNSEAEAIPAAASRRFSSLGSGDMKTERTATQARIPAAASTALGLTTPPRNSTIGVAAASTPSTAAPRRRQSLAMARALASSAAQSPAVISRIA